MPKKPYQKPIKPEIPFDEALERYSKTEPAELREEIARQEADEPVHVTEDIDTGDRFLNYTRRKTGSS